MSAGSPGGNGNAVAMAQLANSAQVGGFTFTQLYGNLGSQVGNDVAAAQQDQTQAQSQLTQAQTERSQVSGVSLNDEATKLLQFQQAYDAVGKLVGVLSNLTTTLLDMVPVHLGAMMLTSLNPVHQEFINSLNLVTQQMNTDELRSISRAGLKHRADVSGQSPDQVSESAVRARRAVGVATDHHQSVEREKRGRRRRAKPARNCFDDITLTYVQTLAA